MRVRPALRCSATCKATGQQCKKYAIVGGTVCASHGGAAAQVKLAARRRWHVERETRKAEAILATTSAIHDRTDQDLDDAFWAGQTWDVRTMRRAANRLEETVREIRQAAKRIERSRQEPPDDEG